jgi:hypothetical protein
VAEASVAPAGLTAQDGNQQVILDWDDYAHPNLAGFHVYRGATSGGPYTRLTGTLITTSYYRDQTVTNGANYVYVVTATQSGFGESDASNEVQANPQGGPTTVCGTITTTRTWALTGSPYTVTCDVTIQSSAILTVDPGVEVRFAAGTGLNVGVALAGGAGGLSAVGTVAGPILLTSAQPSPAPGDWKGINFTSNTIDASTRLDRVTVEYGGAGTHNAILRLDNAVITILRSTIRHSSGHGIRLQAASGVSVDQSTIAQNAGYGLLQEATTIPLTVTSTALTSNGSYPLRIGANGVAALTGNTYTGNAPDAVEVIGGTVNTTQTWRNQGVPLIVVNSDLTVSSLAALTLEAGSELRFGAGLGLAIGSATIPNGSGTLVAVGTSTAPILFTSANATRAPGDWKGLSFSATALNDPAQLDYVVVEYGGGGTANTSIDLNNLLAPARATIRRSTIRHSSGHGVWLRGNQVGNFDYVVNQSTIVQNAGYGVLQDGVAGVLTLTDNTIQNNGAYPVKVRADIVGRLSGNVYGGNNPDAIEVLGQAVNTSQTWLNEGVPYVITGGDVTTQSNAVLTLPAGLVLRFASGVGLNVGVPATNGAGGLIAAGTALAPIVFTSSQASPAPGDWKGLDLRANAIDTSVQLTYIVAEYAGAGTAAANLRSDNNSINLTQSTVRHGSGDGVKLTGGGNVTIQNVDVRLNGGYGISGGLLTVTGTTVQDNGSYPIRVRANSVGQLSGNTYGGNAVEAIEVFDAAVNTTQTWLNEGIPYVVTADINVISNTVLTLAPGLVVRFAPGVGLNIGALVAGADGGLFAVGTPADPIVLTSNQTTPAPGDWKGLNFAPNTIDASTRLEYVVLEHGGAGANNSNIRMNNAAFPIQHSAIRNSSGYGIHSTASTPTVTFTSITGNALYGIFNATSAITINAENNWWGDASGPAHGSNPTGTGDAVSDFVDFTPWLTSPP